METDSFRGGKEKGLIPHTKVKKAGLWVVLGLLLLIILAGVGGYAMHYRATKGSSGESVSEKQSSASVTSRETTLSLTYEWSRVFTSSETESLRATCITPGLRYQVRPDGDDQRILDVPMPGDPPINGVKKGVNIDGNTVGYLQYRVKPGHPMSTGQLLVEYRKK